MASLLGCPVELIDGILGHTSSNDLVAVSLASKELHRLATPLLYSQINLSVHRNNPRPIIHLCRTIFNKPELAKHVTSVRLRDAEPEIQNLYVDSQDYQAKIPKASPPQPTDEDGMPQFIPFIKRSRVTYDRIWIEKLRAGDLNAFVALLLSKLPKLVSFRVGYAVILPYMETADENVPPKFMMGENQFLGKVFQSAALDERDHGLSRLRRLEEISFPGPMDYPGWNPDFCSVWDMVALMSLPSIRSISCWCVNYTAGRPIPISLQQTVAWQSGPPNALHLTSLSLSYVRPGLLTQILKRTPALKSLSWEYKHLPGFVPQRNMLDIVDLDDLVEDLELVQDTLEDLTLSMALHSDPTNWAQWMEYGSYIQIYGSLNGLRDFVNIKSFKVPFQLVLGDWDGDEEGEARLLEESMPPNVKVVTLTDARTSVLYKHSASKEMSRLRSWVSETASLKTPHLEEVCLYLVEGSKQREDEYGSQLGPTFSGTHIKHRVIKAEDERPWEEV